MNELKLLSHFEAVYRLRSFSSAAQELNLTHSTLTKSIKALEDNWNVKLLHRTTRTMAPTEAGKKLYPMALDLLSFAQTVKTETQGGEHTLHIVSGPAILDFMVHPAILRFSEKYPKTKINAELMPPSQAVEELLQRRIHMLLYHHDTLSNLPQSERLRIRRIVEEPYCLISRNNHPVLSGSQSLEDVLKFEWVIAGFDSLFEASLPASVRQLMLQHEFPKYRLLNQAACIDLVAQSDILTTVPSTVAKNLIDSGRVSGFQVKDGLTFSVSAAVLIDAGVEPTVNHFMDCLSLR
jgi:DNA-binding transcriptional LysR family regulator